MNKPAAKEPSMDEILSSIRQIIADEDDGAVTPVPPQAVAAAEPLAIDEELDEPLALSPQQMVSEQEPVEEAPADKAESEPEVEEISFELPDESEDGDVASLANMLADAEADEVEEAEAEAAPEIVLGDDIRFDVDEDGPSSEPVMAQAAPMPDPDLSRDVAERLLEPTTTAASKHAFSKLNQLSVGTGDLTIENMVREMLRPLLKDWLDENLPGVVEKLVEREIERVSRGL